MPIFSQKYVYSLKTHCFHTHISQKTSILSKTRCSHVFFFFQIFHEKLLLSCTWLVKKCQFCQNYTLFWAKKVNMMPFFPISHKNYCSYVHILSKNVHSLKRNSSHLHVLSKKTSTLLKTQCSHVFFFYFSQTPHTLMPIFCQKRQFSQNQNTWWAIKVHKMPFFSDSSRKNRCSHTHILSQVRLFSKEHTALKFMFHEKMSVLSKTLCSCHFFKVFYEKPPAVKPIYGQKNVKSVKITLFWARKDNRMPFFSDFSRKNNRSNLYCTYFLKKSSIL